MVHSPLIMRISVKAVEMSSILKSLMNKLQSLPERNQNLVYDITESPC